MRQIAIVGAGLSGRLLALNLLRSVSSHAAVDICMFDRGGEDAMGPAYSNEADEMLLNVPAGRMGAFSEDQEHFLRWCRDRGIVASRWDFLPRKLYRDYIFELLHQAWQARAGGVTLEHIRGEVTDIDIEDGRATVHVEGREPFVADQAVLALGNFPPRDPRITNQSALDSKRYVRNPWEPGVLDSISRRAMVLLIGTGQTTVDLSVALRRLGHQGRIVALSRRGLLPLAHRGFEPYPSFFDEIREMKAIVDIFKAVRRHLDRAAALGIDARTVIDSLRPDTQTIWSRLDEDEKRRFLRHVFRYWEIIRSRIPPESEAVIDALRASGQLRIVAGRIHELVESGTGMEVHYLPRGHTGCAIETADLVINCIGPESDYRRVDQALVRNLLRRGLIRPGPAGLGLDARANGAIIGRNGTAAEILHTLGSTMKGVLWEVLAVPEIRVQAERLARRLLNGGR